MAEKMRPRSQYHNKKSYDAQLAIVRELLSRAKGVQEDMIDDFEQALYELYRLYEQQIPFFFHVGVLDERQYRRLLASLQGEGVTKISQVLDRIRQEIISLQNQKLMTWLLLDYELTARRTAMSLGPKGVWTMPVNKEARVIQSWCRDKKTVLDRIKINTEDMDYKLRGTILKGIRQKWTFDQMAEHLKRITGMAAYKAKRLVRTETMAVFSKATKDTFLQNGIKYVQIVGDAACGGICLDYVGSYITLEQAEVGDELPPYHPNCACSFCAYEEFQ